MNILNLPIKFLAVSVLLGISVWASAQNHWGRTEYKGKPWVKNLSRPYTVNHGLENRHIAVSASHGRIWREEKNEWRWQRPHLFCTTEDLFTQTIVVPYLIPMLERSGAIVYSPRERDWQREEVIVDNDGRLSKGRYMEGQGKRKWQNSKIPGFAYRQSVYLDGQNPFLDGSARICTTTDNRKKESYAQWIPNIPQKGRYAVYVAYQSFEESVDDALYTVFHKGGITEFHVNQQIGGGTWVYLGTFDFEPGQRHDGMVVLSNYSKRKGVIAADAVRFGGGMGNIARGTKPVTSGLPRYLEGARYSAQWAGMPYPCYSASEGCNDYNDDINTRSYVTNHLNGGSLFNPDTTGLRVPIELQLAVHSDAGYHTDNSFVGSLTICTTDNGDLTHYPGGISRQASKELASDLLNQIQTDLHATYGLNWVAREVRDRNYSESKRAVVPSAIFETLSHQNFADIMLGHDPNFKFTFARSIYKSILRFICNTHKEDAVIAPLPVRAFAIQPGSNGQVHLSWLPQTDPTEHSAQPESYIIYSRSGSGGFDNGQRVRGNRQTLQLPPGILYSFKVTAVNAGGESMDSEILTAYISPVENGRKPILIVNGFQRLSGPKPVQNENIQGFDLLSDAGVPYLSTPAFSGAQLTFSKSGMGRETTDGTGYSGSELEGMLIAGNTFDYPMIHGEAIVASGNYSFTSCSKEAVELGHVRLEEYALVDLILGLEKNDGWSLCSYKTYSLALQQKISNYLNLGGRMFISGAYIASDMSSESERQFTSNILKYNLDAPLPSTSASTTDITGCGLTFQIPRTLNESQYAVQAPDGLRPMNGAFAAFAYANRQCAGIAYNSNRERIMALGFPFESISSRERAPIMSAILRFLLQ